MRIPYFWRKGIRVTANDLWKDCPILEHLHNQPSGVLLDEQFKTYNATDDWTLTQSGAGTAAISIAAPGVLEIDAASSTADQGVNLQHTGGGTFIPAANTEIWFEARFKIVDTYDKVELFVGLSEVDTAIIDGTPSMASTNILAFYCVTGDGVLLFAGEKAGTASDLITTATIAEATYINVGFHVKGVTSAQAYINGTRYGDPIATAGIPIVKLVPSFVCQSFGTNDPIMHLAGFRCFQTR